MIENGIKESEIFSLESLWNASQMISRDKSLSFSNAKCCFLPKMDDYVAKKAGLSVTVFADILRDYKRLIMYRGNTEIAYWNSCIKEIRSYTREQAIEELIRARKLQEKISAISAYLSRLNR